MIDKQEQVVVRASGRWPEQRRTILRAEKTAGQLFNLLFDVPLMPNTFLHCWVNDGPCTAEIKLLLKCDDLGIGKIAHEGDSLVQPSSIVGVGRLVVHGAVRLGEEFILRLC